MAIQKIANCDNNNDKAGFQQLVNSDDDEDEEVKISNNGPGGRDSAPTGKLQH
jgi:hypothetical protein